MAVLVADLIDAAQALADKRNDASISPADWVRYVLYGVKSTYRKLVAADPAMYFSQADFTLAGGAAGSSKDLSTLTWAPAGTFMALHGLDKDPDTQQRRTIRRRNFLERNIAAIGWWTPALFDDNRAYDLRGRTLAITPYELGAGNYRAYARLGPYLFTSSSDTNPLDWQIEPYDERVVIIAARYGLGIEESDTGPWSQRLLELNDEIMAEHSRDDGEGATIIDVEDDDAPWPR